MTPPIDDDDAWIGWQKEWSIRSDTTYLNHGSFGPPSNRVRQRQLQWQQQLNSQPMDFLVRHFEPAWLNARRELAQFLGTDPVNLVFVENSTAAMNTVAESFALSPGDQVLLTDHEYGAVLRVWQRACERAGADPPCIASLPKKFESAQQVVDAIFSAVTPKTRLLVVSHITSPTAIVLPVPQICKEAKRRGLAVCVDGPHAPVQVPLALDELSPDFYTASLHKWLAAPIGSGFLFVDPKWQPKIQTPLLSWGRVTPQKPTCWWDEFIWTGTRDPSAYLAVPAAIELFHEVGLANFRARTHYLARLARELISELTGLPETTPDSPQWYGSMVNVALPPGDAFELQQKLWQEHQIEVPIIDHLEQRSIRVSCHLYNCASEVEKLVQCLRRLL